MIRENLNKIPFIVLGAISGILLGVFLEIFSRSIFLFEVYLCRSNPSPSTVTIPCSSYYPFSWWFFPLLVFIAVTFATFIVQHYAAIYIKSVIWFWQTVGIVTLLILGSFSVIYVFYDWYLEEFETDFYSVLFGLKKDFSFLFIAFPIIAIFNLLFALILKRLKTHLP